MESFVRAHKRDTGTVQHCAEALVTAFRKETKAMYAGFHIAGYDSAGGIDLPVVYRLPAGSDVLERVNTEAEPFGASLDGDRDVTDRLFQKVGIEGENGFAPFPHYETAYRLFTLQDAVEFATFAIRVTAETMNFQSRPASVGGPIDVLVIRPSGPEWLQRKVVRVKP